MSLSSISLSDRLAKLRELFPAAEIDGLVVPSPDAHNSEYSRDADARRAFVTGFDGSAGTALVTSTDAHVWTDSRYFVQAEKQLPEFWTLMRMGDEGVPSLAEHMASLPRGTRIGYCSLFTSPSLARSWQLAAGEGVTFVPLVDDLVDQVWTDKQAGETHPIRVHPLKYAGVSAADKLTAMRKHAAGQGADAIALTALADICWALNLRGADIPCNPFFIAYLAVEPEGGALFVDAAQVTEPAREHLDQLGLRVRPYEEAIAGFGALATQHRVLVESTTCNAAVYAALGESAVDGENPVVLPRALKNDAELQAMWAAHIRDAAPLCRYFSWLEETVRAGESVTESEGADKLLAFRAEETGFRGPSFTTISSTGPNGAIIHYSPVAGECPAIAVDAVYLCDSGGQYEDGTTDVTRTMWLGEGPAPQHPKDCYTRVLQGHIGLARAVFPHGTTGAQLDALARVPLWRAGLNYGHGTGHGVGAHLGVHEGPQRVSPVAGATATPMQNGMTITNEPGYYETGAFGIRIENMLVTRKSASIGKGFGGVQYYEFENFTYVPMCRAMINVDMLSADEKEYLNAYHAKCRELVLPLVEGRDARATAWLKRETEPL